MNEDIKKEFDAMRGAVHVFNDSSVLLEDIVIKGLGPLVLRHGVDLRKSYISLAILYAFSCEIGLKALALKVEKEIPHKHDLKSLFENLPDDMQQNIKKQLEGNLRENFDELIDRNKNAFIEWRYYYEGGDKVVDIIFLRKLAQAIGTECGK